MRKKVLVLVALVVVASVLTRIVGEADEKGKTSSKHYTVLDLKVDDGRDRVAVKERIYSPDCKTEDNMKATLRAALDSMQETGPYSYQKHPEAIWIWLSNSREQNGEKDWDWSVMVSRDHPNTEAEFIIR